MPITADGYSSELLDELRGGKDIVGKPQVSAIDRALAYGIALPAQVMSNVGQSLGNLFGVGGDPLFDASMVPAQTGWQTAADVGGKGLAPVIAEFALTGKALNPALAEIGSPLLRNVVRDAAQFSFLGLQEGRGMGAEQAAEGGAAGLLTGLSRMSRILPAAGLGLLSKAYFDSQHPGEKVVGDWSRGDISGLALAGASMLPGRVGWRTPIADRFKITEGPLERPGMNIMEGQMEGPMPRGIQEGSYQGPAHDLSEMASPNISSPIGDIYSAMGAPVPAIRNQQNLIDAFRNEQRAITGIQQVSRPNLTLDAFAAGRDMGTPVQLPPMVKPGRTSDIYEAMGAPSIEASVARENAQIDFERSVGFHSGPPYPEITSGGIPFKNRQLTELILEVQSKTDEATFAEIVRGQPLDVEQAAAYYKYKNYQIQAKLGQTGGRTAEEMVQGSEEAAMELEAALARRGKLPPRPSWENEFQLSLGLSRPSVRALMGAAIGSETSDDPTQRAANMAILAGLMAAGPSIIKAISGSAKTAPDVLGNTGPRIRSTVRPEDGVRGGKISDETLHSMQRNNPAGVVEVPITKASGSVTPPKGKVGVADPFPSPGSETATLQDIIPVIKLPNGKIISEPGARSHANLMGHPEVEALLAKGDEFLEGAEFGFAAKGRWIPRDALSDIAKTDEVLGSQSLREGLQKGSVPNNSFDLSSYEKIQGGMKMKPQEGGFIMPEITAGLARATVGGLVGGGIGAQFDEPGDSTNFALGAMSGALITMTGPAIGRSILESLRRTKIKPPLPAGTVSRTTGSWINNFKQNWETRVEEAAGQFFNSSSRVSDRFMRYLDTGFGLTMPLAVKNVLLQARGAASVLLDTMDNSLINMSMRYTPDDVIKKITNNYFDGNFGIGKAGRDAYLQAMLPHTANNAGNLSYAQFAVTARQTVDGLQRMLADGIGNAKMKNIVESSVGRYLTRSYALFTNPRYNPSEESIEKLAQYLAQETKIDPSTKKVVALMGTTSLNDIKSALRQHIREVKATKGSYVAITPQGEAIEQGIMKERIVQKDPVTGKPLTDAAGNEIRAMRDEWRQFYGEITDPTQRIYQTVARLRPMAEASRYFKAVSDVEVGGLKQVFASADEKKLVEQQLLHSMQNATTPEAKAAIELKLAALKNYQYVQPFSKYGDLQGHTVSRHVWDTLKTYDSITDTTSGWLRGMANAHTMIKLTRTALSPITVMRNIITAPFFMAISKAAPQDAVTAWKIMHDVNHPLRAEILQRGIGNADQVMTEFRKEFDSLTGSKFNFGTLDMTNLGMGRLDFDLAEKVVRRGFRNVLDFYRQPDNVVRISTYLSAKRRISQELGLGLQHPEVIEKAVNWTNRYTMNYDALPPAIKQLRQIPLMNLFLSYTYEMGRIGKNLIEDAVKGGDGITSHGRLHAMAMLTGLAVVPELLQNSSKDNLSPKDREEWEQIEKRLPDYSRTRYRFGMEKDPKTGMFHYYDFTPLMPSDSFNQMGKAIMRQDWRALAEVNPLVGLENTPIFNIIAKQVSGKDRNKTFRKIGEGGASDRFASVAKEVTPPIPFVFPWTTEGERFTLAYEKNDKGEFGLTNSKTGIRVTPLDVWTPYFTGIRPGSVNGEAIFKQYEASAKQDIANEITYANQILKMKDLPEAKRAQVVQRTKEAISRIQQRYAEQVE